MPFRLSLWSYDWAPTQQALTAYPEDPSAQQASPRGRGHTPSTLPSLPGPGHEGTLPSSASTCKSPPRAWQGRLSPTLPAQPRKPPRCSQHSASARLGSVSGWGVHSHSARPGTCPGTAAPAGRAVTAAASPGTRARAHSQGQSTARDKARGAASQTQGPPRPNTSSRASRRQRTRLLQAPPLLLPPRKVPEPG